MNYSIPSTDNMLLSRAQDLTDIEAALLDAQGHIRCLPTRELQRFGIEKILHFAHKHAIYQFPTIELMELLRAEIGNLNTCIEIGAGRGDVGRCIGIKLTDDHQQRRPEIKKQYEQWQQPVINYPSDVEKLNYKQAVKKYRPHTVLGCWITHQWVLNRMEQAGNMYGIDIDWLMNRVKKIVFVGNTHVHKNMLMPGFCEHKTIIDNQNRFIVSRGVQGYNFISVFTR